jgi:hypothetical protein
MHGHPVYLPRRGRGGDVATIEGRSHHQSLMLHRDELEKGRDEGARRTVGETRVEKEQWCSAELLQLKVDVRRDPKGRRRCLCGAKIFCKP